MRDFSFRKKYLENGNWRKLLLKLMFPYYDKIINGQ